MASAKPRFDIAISFLSSDERIASALQDKLSSGSKVFFYPRNQEDLAGTDGMESMRQPFIDDSLISVVLYRERWGKTPWTRVEEAAIKDGCLKHGWHRLFFMSLDDDAPLPAWLPNTHVRFSYAHFGLEQAVGAIKARVQECGGVIAPVTALSRARAVEAESSRLKRKEELFASQQWIRDTVRPAVAELFDEMARIIAQISTELGMIVRHGASTNPDSAMDVFGLTNGRVSINVAWVQPYTNIMGKLELKEFHNEIILPGENKLYLAGHPPSEQGKRIFEPDLSIDENLCWVDKGGPGEQLSTTVLADRAVQLFLDLCQRANRGEIDTTSEYYRSFQRDWRESE